MAARVSAPSRPPHADETAEWSREPLPRHIDDVVFLDGDHVYTPSFTLPSHGDLPGPLLPAGDQSHGLVGHQQLIAFAPHL
jgi:hypothetical protein